MQAFEQHRGVAVRLPQVNIDTDAIIRIERLMMVPRARLGDYAFEMLRQDPDGQPRKDCWLNAPAFAHASIVLAGRNFGCGSSRETAVWAMQGRGIRCVIAPSFGDIFRMNCVKNGVLPIALEEAVHTALVNDWSPDGGDAATYTVDLRGLRITTPKGRHVAFTLPAFERQQLLDGEDEIAATRKLDDRIASHLQAWHAQHPWMHTPPR